MYTRLGLTLSWTCETGLSTAISFVRLALTYSNVDRLLARPLREHDLIRRQRKARAVLVLLNRVAIALVHLEPETAEALRRIDVGETRGVPVPQRGVALGLRGARHVRGVRHLDAVHLAVSAGAGGVGPGELDDARVVLGDVEELEDSGC